MDLFRLPQRQTLVRQASIEKPTNKFGKSVLILSRALYRLSRFDLSAIPTGKRRAALALQLRQWSPYQTPEFRVHWNDGIALVFCWDSKALADRLDTAPHKTHIVPEECFYPPPAHDITLIQASDGYIAQRWNAGTLTHSRWWSAPPTQQEWSMFLRDNGLQTSTVPQALIPERHHSPVFSVHKPGKTSELSTIEQYSHIFMAMALLIPVATLGIQHHKLTRAIAKAEHEQQQQMLSANTIVDARQAALEHAAAAKDIFALSMQPKQLTLMAAIAAKLPPDGSYIKEWEFNDTQLKITIASPNGDITSATYIESLSTTSLFTQIQPISTADNRSLGLSMKILPRQPDGETPEDANTAR